MVHTPGPDDRRRRRGRRDVIDIGPSKTQTDGGQTPQESIRENRASYYLRGAANGGLAIVATTITADYFGVIAAVVIALVMMGIIRLMELRIKAGTA